MHCCAPCSSAYGCSSIPNAYKGKIAAAVKESTGRELKLPGDIKLSVIPWVALELGPASLGNPPGFSDEPFLSFTHASVRVRLLPLLRQHLGSRSRARSRDWIYACARMRQGEAIGRAPNPSSAGQNQTWITPMQPGALESLANIRIQNGRVSYEGITVEKFNLETGSLASDRHIPIHLTFDASRAPAGEQLSLNAKFDLSQDAAHKPLQFSGVNVSGTLARPGDGRPVHWDLSAPGLNINMNEQTVAAPAFNFNYSGVHFTGSFQATRIIDDLRIAGSLSLAPCSCGSLNRGWDSRCPRRAIRRRCRSCPRPPILPTTRRRLG